MKIPIHIAEKLLLLSQGEIIPSSMAKHSSIEDMVSEGIIERSGRVQKKLFIQNSASLHLYLQNKYGINDLNRYIAVSKQENVQRNELVVIASNSKMKSVRTFKGFLINSYHPIQAQLNGKSIILNFTNGTFQFIYDFSNFIPEKNITIVGIENPENFRWIEQQKHLFKNIKPLFVCRYPQNQSKDLIKWLKSIPNDYLHFGDFDFAGIGIYINEFKEHLGKKAEYFVPDNLEELLSLNGNRNLYDTQKINFKLEFIKEEKLLKLIRTIHQNKKGLEQEAFILK